MQAGRIVSSSTLVLKSQNQNPRIISGTVDGGTGKDLLIVIVIRLSHMKYRQEIVYWLFCKNTTE